MNKQSVYPKLVRVIAGFHFFIVFLVLLFIFGSLLGIVQLFSTLFILGNLLFMILIFVVSRKGYMCPLTFLENVARDKAGLQQIRGEFLFHYWRIRPPVFKAYSISAVIVLVLSIGRYLLKL